MNSRGVFEGVVGAESCRQTLPVEKSRFLELFQDFPGCSSTFLPLVWKLFWLPGEEERSNGQEGFAKC